MKRTEFEWGHLANSVAIAAGLILAGAPAYAAAGDSSAIEEIVVRADTSLFSRLGELGRRGILPGEEVNRIGATHIRETLARIPGVWISRGSGQVGTQDRLTRTLGFRDLPVDLAVRRVVP